MAGERGRRWTDPSSDATPLLRKLLEVERDAAPSNARLRELASRIAKSPGISESQPWQAASGAPERS